MVKSLNSSGRVLEVLYPHLSMPCSPAALGLRSAEVRVRRGHFLLPPGGAVRRTINLLLHSRLSLYDVQWTIQGTRIKNLSLLNKQKKKNPIPRPARLFSLGVSSASTGPDHKSLLTFSPESWLRTHTPVAPCPSHLLTGVPEDLC